MSRAMHRAGELEDAVGQRRLAVVDVGDDAEVADMVERGHARARLSWSVGRAGVPPGGRAASVPARGHADERARARPRRMPARTTGRARPSRGRVASAHRSATTGAGGTSPAAPPAPPGPRPRRRSSETQLAELLDVQRLGGGHVDDAADDDREQDDRDQRPPGRDRRSRAARARARSSTPASSRGAHEHERLDRAMRRPSTKPIWRRMKYTSATKLNADDERRRQRDAAARRAACRARRRAPRSGRG